MRNAEYWKQRFAQLEAAQNEMSLKSLPKIEKQYKRAQKLIESDILHWYARLAKNNSITLAEARKLLSKDELEEFKWEVEEYIKRARENALDGRWVKELENASARFHISRLEALKIHTENSLQELFAAQHGTFTTLLFNTYQSGYYHTAFELQKGFGVGFEIAGLNQSQIEKVLAKPWAADGYNFSERIWKNKQKLIGEVHRQLTQNLLTGGDPQKAINAIAKKLSTSKSNAGRLVMTESAYFSSAAQGECYNNLGVEEYEILATLDAHTSDICREMDKKHFPMKDYRAGVTAPPFHPWCRSTTIPYFEENFGQIGERAARDTNGKTYYVPANMTFDEWEAAFVKGDKSVLKKYGLDLTDGENSDIIKKESEWLSARFKDAQSIDEAKEYAKNILGFDYLQYDKFNLDAANMVNREIARVYDVFGDLHKGGYLDGIMHDTSRDKDWAAAYQKNLHVVIMREVSTKNALSRLAKEAKENFDLGAWSTSAAEHGIRHELGHAVKYWLTDNSPGKLSKISSLRKQIENDIGLDFWFADDNVENMKKAGEVISYYALCSDDEFVAEAVAEYMNGNPRETAKKVVEILLGKE
ncbi:MAG: minor capsid protein [Oscillospiraceae bacterium]|nr:minor capsid protein [Oscillospiraceae bacterium]